MENETPSGLGLLGAGRDVAGLPFFPLPSPLFLQGMVAPMFPIYPLSPSRGLMGTPVCCNKLAQDPGFRMLQEVSNVLKMKDIRSFLIRLPKSSTNPITMRGHP